MALMTAIFLKPAWWASRLASLISWAPKPMCWGAWSAPGPGCAPCSGSDVIHAGLGLAVVHGIVTAHGGAIKLESEIGKGSKFTLWFSLADE